MKTIPTTSNYTPRAQLFVFAVSLLAALLLPQTLRASLPIEQAQREFQARYYFIKGTYVPWLPCACQTPAPAFPPDGFYGDLTSNRALEVQLVRDLATKFNTLALYQYFLNTPDGHAGIEGTPYNPGAWGPVYYFQSSDMPLPTTIDQSNDAACLQTLLTYLNKLNYVLAPSEPTYMGLPGMAFRTGRGELTNADGCDLAKAAASTAWDASTWSPGTSGNWFSQSTICSSTEYPTFTKYVAEIDCWGGSISAPSTYGTFTNEYFGFVQGTLLVYISLTNNPGGLGLTTTPFALAADSKYHLAVTTSVLAADAYSSPPLGEDKPGIAGDCAADNSIWEGWVMQNAFLVLAPQFNANPDDIHCGDGACPSCAGSAVTPGKVTTANRSLDLRISLGPDSYGKSAGYLYLHADQASPALYSLASLLCVTPTGIASLADLGGTVAAANVTVTAQTTSAGYTLNFTDNANPSQSLASVTVQSTNSPNGLLITEVLGGGSPRVIQFNYTPISPSSWTWDMIEGNGLRTESRTTTWSTPTNRADAVVVKDNTAAIAAQTTENYRLFPWGLTLVQQTLGTGTSAKTTTWTYYTDPVNDRANYGQLKQLVEPSGRWEKYQYDSTGRLTYKVAQFGNNLTTSPDNSNRVTQITCSGNVITTVESLLGHEIARTIEVHAWDEVNAFDQIQTVRCATPGAGLGAAGNLTNILWQATDPWRTGHAWDTLAELRPDGTMTLYNYNAPLTTVQTGDTGWAWSDKVNWTPATNWTVLDGTQTTTTVGDWGQPISVQVLDLSSQLLTGSDTYGSYDSLRRPLIVTHDLERTTEQYTYSCCGLDTYVDRDGTTNQYFYDAAKRQIASLRLGILTSNVLDAAGNVLQSIRFGSDGSPVLLSQTAYDYAGRIVSETNALNGVTSHSETYASNGRTVSTTYPDQGTRIELYNQDGSLQSVTGTAAFPVYYQYGYDAAVASPYTLENKGSSTGSEWTKTYNDMLGRAYKTVYAGPTAPTAVAFFNSLGQCTNQVDPDLVSTLYAFNSKGEQTYVIVDSNRTHQIEWSGTSVDRITLVTNDVVNNDAVSGNGITVRRTRTFVWATTANTPTLVRTEEASADGLQTWSTIWNNSVAATTHGQTVYGGGGARTLTTAAPDGSHNVSAYANGRLASVTRFDSLNSQLSSINYTYDPHGRLSTATDARNGATTSAYLYNSDLVRSITTPNPGTLGGSPQTTIFYYNLMLQATNIVQPDGTSVTSEFYPTGQLKRQYGSRIYPVGYSYDYAGRVLTMTNWGAFPSAGARVTTWNYNPYRGWLDSKTYDGGAAGPAYTYTDAGRLRTRQWARNITTTYTYDNAGGLSGVSYSDGTTPGLSYTCDRRGRPATVTQNSIQDTLTYNDANLLLSEAYSGGLLANLSVTSGFDQYLRRTSLTLNSQLSTLNSVSYGYDNASRLQTVTDNTTNTPYSATYSYLANSLLVSNIVFKQSSTTRMSRTNQWDYLNRLLGVSSAASALSFAYSYNNANQRTRATLADNSYWLFNYDSLGQVTSGHKYWPDQTPVAGQQFEYTFDNIGNRTSTKAGGDQNGANQRPANYGANTLNQYTNRDVPAAFDVVGVALATNTVTVNSQTAYRKGEYFRSEVPVSNGSSAVWQAATVHETGQTDVTGSVFVPKNQERFYYDLDGNLTQDGRWIYAWDAENRLISLTPSTLVGPQISLKLEYDWQGRRIHKQVWPNTTWNGNPTNDVKFVYDGWNLIAILNSSFNLQNSFMWGLDLSGSPQGAGGVGGLLEVVYKGTQTTNCFVAFDGNGNVSGLVNAADGTTLAQYEYGPFGELLRATGPMAKANPFRFSTKYQDDETDLLYYGYRYYNASTGRWLSQDPIGERGGMNLYGFVGNQPGQFVDILGLTWWKPWTWFDPDMGDSTMLPSGDWYAPPLPKPPGAPDFQEEIDEQISALESRAGDTRRVCKTVSGTAYAVLEFMPQSAFSQGVLGERLSGEKVGVGTRVVAIGASLPGSFVVTKVVGKTVTVCCGEIKICLFIQRHHLIPKARFKNNRLIQAAGVNIEKDANNLMDLLNHGGDHTEEYYRTVDALLRQAYNDYESGKMTATEAYQGVCKTLREGVTDGSIRPYNSKDVLSAP
jgi:RHS repeat-associated protein